MPFLLLLDCSMVIVSPPKMFLLMPVVLPASPAFWSPLPRAAIYSISATGVLVIVFASVMQAGDFNSSFSEVFRAAVVGLLLCLLSMVYMGCIVIGCSDSSWIDEDSFWVWRRVESVTRIRVPAGVCWMFWRF